MIITTYTCDCCGHTQATNDKMRYIAINYNLKDYGPGTNFHQKLWCEACCKKFKLYWESPTSISPPIITLEDVVREIIREEINNI